MLRAMAKQAPTIANQAALTVLDLAVEMCTKPCIVLLSKNSRNLSKTILIHLGFVIYFGLQVLLHLCLMLRTDCGLGVMVDFGTRKTFTLKVKN